MSHDPDRPDDALAALTGGAPVLDAAAPAALIDGAPILDAAAGPRLAGRAPIAARPRLALRVNGARLGDATRPPTTATATDAPVPARRFGLRSHGAALSTRPNDYMPDDDNGSGVAS